MSESHEFTCFLMGGQSRLIQCAEILLQKGHKICGVISAEPSIQRWTKKKNLRQIMPSADIVGLLEQQHFDLFFSIDNFWTVPNDILTLPRKYAINFHDAPLPKYAGVNATNWAILKGESVHGVTWHVMTDQIDAGDILKQETFPISDGETALTLNAKCYEKSIQCFAELIDELSEGREKPIQQDLENRTYFPRWKRPSVACTVDWTHSAEEIYALFCGLDYGTYPNPLGLPKLFLGDQAVIVKQIEVLESKLFLAPGTITQVTDETINVATRTHEVTLREFISFDNKPLAPSLFLMTSGLREGDVLPILEAERTDTITRINSALCKHEDFWADRLASLEPIEIPYAKRRVSSSDNKQYIKERFSTFTPTPASREVSENPGDFVMAAFALYLSRIGGKETFDVNFRDVSLQQELSGNESFFASHVPLRIEMEYEQGFREFYKAVQQQIELIRAHGSYARDLLLRDPGLREAFCHNAIAGLPVTIERVESLSGYQPKCDAELVVVIPDHGKECHWLYDKEVLDTTAIDRMRDQFKVLLNDIASGRDRSIGELSIIPEQECHMILTEWHGPNMEYPQDTCLHHLFEAQAKRTPDAEALVFENERLTYRRLNRRANQVAHQLRALGVGPETLVGLCVERSLEMIIGILGILKSGGAYVPLDPTYPQERLTFMLEDTQASVILTQRSLIASLPAHSAEILCLDAPDLEAASDDAKADENPVSDVKPENIAYVIYTSGSTGNPKGVLIPHGNVTRLFDATESWFNFGRKDVWTLFHSYAFDFSVWEMWGALLYGGRLVVVPYEISRSPKEFYKLLKKEHVTVLNQTPSAFYQLIQTEESLPSEGKLSLRLIIFGGEALELKNLKPWINRHGDQRPQLVNMYGITETTVHVTYRPISNKDVQSGQGSVIGEPIPDLQLYVLDRNLMPVPIGVAGELYVGGAGLARGYLNRPELTAERFIPDPFTETPEARLYKTGDLARFLPNRDLEYLARADLQVQIRGFRVELGEIEAVLAELESVNRTVVVVREDQPGDQRLVAYFVPPSDHPVNITELRNHLRTKLPDYMIPQHIVKLENIPLTINGKVDRRALPAPPEDRQTQETYVAPQNEVERIVAEIWQEVLHVKNIGIRDSFFELGGHSLLLVKMLSKLQEAFANELSIVDMFRHPTIETLAKFLTQKKKVGPSFAATYDIVNKQKESLKRQKRLATVRRYFDEQRHHSFRR